MAENEAKAKNNLPNTQLGNVNPAFNVEDYNRGHDEMKNKLLYYNMYPCKNSFSSI